MQRVGDILPSLARFRSYRAHADELEAMKSWPPARSPGPMARRSRIERDHERALDRAFAEASVVSTWYGTLHARILSAHYLYGEDWHDISASEGIPYDKTKKLAYSALAWLDGWVRAFGEGEPRA
jgi:hypothetical protein